MRITEASQPFAAVYRGVPVFLAMFMGVRASGERVQGVAAMYPDGSKVIAVTPDRGRN